MDCRSPLVPQQHQGRQRNRHAHAEKCTVLRNIPDRAFHEAGLIDKQQPAGFPHLITGAGSPIVLQGLALRGHVVDQRWSGHETHSADPGLQIPGILTVAKAYSPVRTARGAPSSTKRRMVRLGRLRPVRLSDRGPGSRRGRARAVFPRIRSSRKMPDRSASHGTRWDEIALIGAAVAIFASLVLA
jgi:hypothetical protein